MIYIALFGEAEKGGFETAYFYENFEELDQFFGNPPQSSSGLFNAVQALLFKSNLINFKVFEERDSL